VIDHRNNLPTIFFPKTDRYNGIDTIHTNNNIILHYCRVSVPVASFRRVHMSFVLLLMLLHCSCRQVLFQTVSQTFYSIARFSLSTRRFRPPSRAKPP